MPDIWSGLGVEISKKSEGEWLYQVGGETRGPLPMQVIAQKLINGEIGLRTFVAREGGEFHPISQVAAFAQHITEAKKQVHKRAAAKMRRLMLIFAFPAIALLSVAGYFVWVELAQNRAEAMRVAKAKQAELEAKRKKAEALPDMGLVALVSLGSEDTVKISKHTGRKKNPNRKTGTFGITNRANEPEEMVQQCMLSQGAILGTLKKNLAKINVCVEDERSRDTQGQMPSTLELEFIVQTSGKVTDFALKDRHYRVGPLNNCLIKVFNTIKFPASNGANCPVSLPIKIGK
ncbi:MAG: DUF4339 domain-containing protein [Deltaproteobacteria bacterium]|nr:DUF4339 domain-containing protein [Deltaproteobacteria bacterium]